MTAGLSDAGPNVATILVRRYFSKSISVMMSTHDPRIWSSPYIAPRIADDRCAVGRWVACWSARHSRSYGKREAPAQRFTVQRGP